MAHAAADACSCLRLRLPPAQVLECFTEGQGACGWGSAAEFLNQLTRKQLVSETYYPLVSNRNGGVVGE